MRACLVYEANLANCAHVDTLMKLSQKVEQVPLRGKSARLLAKSEVTKLYLQLTFDKGHSKAFYFLYAEEQKQHQKLPRISTFLLNHV